MYYRREKYDSEYNKLIKIAYQHIIQEFLLSELIQEIILHAYTNLIFRDYIIHVVLWKFPRIS